jgi:hypothetical protein
VRPYPVTVETGDALLDERRPGPYVAETVAITVEGAYVVVEV